MELDWPAEEQSQTLAVGEIKVFRGVLVSRVHACFVWLCPPAARLAVERRGLCAVLLCPWDGAVQPHAVPRRCLRHRRAAVHRPGVLLPALPAPRP